MRRIIVVIFRFTILQIVKCTQLRKEGRKQKFTSTKLLKPRAAAHEEDPSLIAHNGGCGLCAAFISLGWFDCHDPLAIFIRITYVWSLTNSENTASTPNIFPVLLPFFCPRQSCCQKDKSIIFLPPHSDKIIIFHTKRWTQKDRICRLLFLS